MQNEEGVDPWEVEDVRMWAVSSHGAIQISEDNYKGRNKS